MTSKDDTSKRNTRHVVMNQAQVYQVKQGLLHQNEVLKGVMFNTSSGKAVLDYHSALLEIARLWEQLYVTPECRDLARDESEVMYEEAKRAFLDRIAEFGAD